MEAKKAKKNKVRGIKNAFIVIIICFIVALVVFTQVLGAPQRTPWQSWNSHLP